MAQPTPVPSPMSCAECGNALPDRKGGRRYCSKQCRNQALYKSDAYAKGRANRTERRKRDPEFRRRENEKRKHHPRYGIRAQYAKVCVWCDREFTTKEPQSQGCTAEHSRLYNAWQRGEVLSLAWSPPRPKSAPKPKRDKWAGRVRFVAGSCALCGELFVHDLKLAGMPSRYCCKACQMSAAKDRRRARKRDAYVSDVSRAKVYKRDRYRCHICGGRLAMKQKAPHPKAPVIDHLIPLAVGGTHEMANVAAAHFLCNSQKSANAANDQLLLVG